MAEMEKAPGLMSGPPQGGQPPMQPGQDAAPQEQAGDVSPEEQEQYETFVTRALDLMSNEKALPGILESLSAGEPIEALASTAAKVVMRVEDAAKQKGVGLAQDVVFHAGQEIVEHVADLARAAKIHAFTEEELEGAFYRAVDLYREEKQARGELDQQALSQDWAALVQADQQGTLTEILPQLKERSGG